MQDQTTEKVQSNKRVKDPWWRFALGVLLLYAGVKSLFIPDPNMPIELQYSNLTQKISGDLFQVVVCLVGIWLIIGGIIILRKKQANS
jgi:uncharacterized membrane protein HdeD (DUF308 family)